MKRILITGANSYIGVSFEKYLQSFSDEYQVDTVDMLDGSWREFSFAGYDAVFHVAGIAHIKETQKNSHLYYEINRDLPVEVAIKAKSDGVKQFVFLSTMNVYGINSGIVTKETVPAPTTNYGKSKLEAEQLLKPLEAENFIITILRPPMVYGKGCKGNYQVLKSIAEKLPLFPETNNKRSLIYIDNLCSFVKLAVNMQLSGYYFPQNNEYVNITSMAKAIRIAQNKRFHKSRFLGACAKLGTRFSIKLEKAFGSLCYEGTENMNYSYCVVDNDESFKRSV